MNATVAHVALALLAAVASTGCGSAADAEPETKSFDFSETSLTITTDNGAVDIETSDIDDIEVTRWFSGNAHEGTWDLNGSTLTLDSSCGLFRDCDARYAITVPVDVAVELEGQNGTIDAREFSQRLSIRTQNGTITVTDSSGDIDLHTDNGEQHVATSTPGRLTSRTDNGAIDIALDQPPTRISVTAASGRIHLTLPGNAAYDVTIDTDHDDIDNQLDTDANSPYQVGVETDNGPVSLRRGS